MINYFLLTISIFFFMTWLYKRTGFVFLFPVLTSTLTIILILVLFHIPYERYMEGGKIITFFLSPAVVAMAYPLYMQWDVIMKYKKTIISSTIVALFAGVISVVTLTLLFHLEEELLLSFVPKSITSPVAMQISETIGGNPQLTVIFVIAAGITGAITGPQIFKLFRIDTAISKGVAMGSVAHGIGVSKLHEEGELTLSIGSVAMTLSAILGAVFCPLVVYFFF